MRGGPEMSRAERCSQAPTAGENRSPRAIPNTCRVRFNDPNDIKKSRDGARKKPEQKEGQERRDEPTFLHSRFSISWATCDFLRFCNFEISSSCCSSFLALLPPIMLNKTNSGTQGEGNGTRRNLQKKTRGQILHCRRQRGKDSRLGRREKFSVMMTRHLWLSEEMTEKLWSG